MKLKLTILIIFLKFGFSFGQLKVSGEVIYEVTLNKSKFASGLKEDNDNSRKLRTLIQNSTNLEYSLRFFNYESLYQQVKLMESDANKGLNLTKIFAGNNNIYFFNSASKESIDQTTIDGKKYLIERIVTDWKLTNESKKIGKYQCFKAIIKNQNGSYGETIAWYTPEIHVQFGPYRFNNLPGLIIELHDKTVVFSAKKISLNKKVNIIKPNEGIKISYAEFKNKFGSVFKE